MPEALSIVIAIFTMIITTITVYMLTRVRAQHAVQVEALQTLVDMLEKQNADLSRRLSRMQTRAMFDDTQPVTAEEMAYVMTSLGAPVQAPAGNSELLDQILADLDALGGDE